MKSEADLYHPIWVARDRRYDGKVFAGVRTTGVYCRPICPARTAFKKNMVFFASAAAAEQAGFRPCRRCRPETSPGTPAWQGASVSVSRALRLIADGWVSEHGLPALVHRLGLSDRQIRRLFEKHLGAPPLAVLRTHQLDLARKLLDETRRPVTEIAFASGFSSLRRFNDAFKARFGLSPREARQKLRAKTPRSPEFLRLKLPYRPPLDWESLLSFFAARAIPGVEACEGGAYSRTFETASGAGWFSVSPSEQEGCLELQVSNLPASELLRIVACVRRMFDLDADPRVITARLGQDPALREVLRRHPGLRIPGAWDGFEIATRAILGQQVSVAAATTLAGRIAEEYGAVVEFPGAPRLSRLFPKTKALRSARLEGQGVVGSRAGAIRELAARVADGRIDFSEDVERFTERLTAIRGVGPWTAGYLAIRALREPNVLLSDDLVIRRELERTPGAKDWEPWRSYVTLYLWRKAAHEQERKSKK